MKKDKGNRGGNFLRGLTVDKIKAGAKKTTPGKGIWAGCFDLEPSVEVTDIRTGEACKVRRICEDGGFIGCVMLDGCNIWFQAWDFKLPKEKARLTKV